MGAEVKMITPQSGWTIFKFGATHELRYEVAAKLLVSYQQDPVSELMPVSICLGPTDDLYVLSDNPDKTISLSELKAPGYYSFRNIALPDRALERSVTMAGRQISDTFHLFILDRGERSYNEGSVPKIVEVVVKADTATTVVHDISIKEGVIEPLSLVILDDDTFIIGDGGVNDQPGNLIRVKISQNWEAEWLQLEVESDALVAPKSLVRVDASDLFVLDVGLQPWYSPQSHPFVRNKARDAAIYRFIGNLVGKEAKASLKRVSEAGELVFPIDMAMYDDVLYIADPGVMRTGVNNNWRARRHEFAVAVHFPENGLPSVMEQWEDFVRPILGDISDIIERDKPAHTFCTIYSQEI